MSINYFVQQSFLIIRYRYLKKIKSLFSMTFLRLAGMKIGKGTYFSDAKVTWPHQVSIGNNCILEHSLYFKYDGIWADGPSIVIGDKVFIGNNTEFNIIDKIIIGNDCLIASGCRFIDHSHGFKYGQIIRKQKSSKKAIIIGSDVWVGCNVVVLKGVNIANGAIVGAGSVVTKSILENEIWAGVPAKKIGNRGL